MKRFFQNARQLAEKGQNFFKNKSKKSDEEPKLRVVHIHHEGNGQIQFRCPHCSTNNITRSNISLAVARTCSNPNCGESFKVQR